MSPPRKPIASASHTELVPASPSQADQASHNYSHLPLAVFNEPFGPHPSADSDNIEIYTPSPTNLHIHQNIGGPPSLSDRQQYAITNAATGATICTVHGQGKLASAHNKRRFQCPDYKNQELFTLETRVRTLRETFCAESPLGRDCGFEIRREYGGDGSESTVTFVNAEDGESVECKVQADHVARFLWILWRGQPVARIQRMAMDVGKVKLVMKAQRRLEYEVTIAANVDISMIAAVCVCLEGLKYGKT